MKNYCRQKTINRQRVAMCSLCSLMFASCCVAQNRKWNKMIITWWILQPFLHVQLIRLLGRCIILPDILKGWLMCVSVLKRAHRMNSETMHDRRLHPRRGWLLFWWVCEDARAAYSPRLKVGTQINHYIRNDWSALALLAILIRGFSSLSLLVMLGPRQHNVVMIISRDDEDMDHVTCTHNSSVTYFF